MLVRVILISFDMLFTPSGSFFHSMYFDENLVSFSHYDFLSHFPEVTPICVPPCESPFLCIGMFTSHLLHPYCTVGHLWPPSIIPQGGPISVLHLSFHPCSQHDNLFPYIEHFPLAWLTIMEFLLSSFLTPKWMKRSSSMISSFHAR